MSTKGTPTGNKSKPLIPRRSDGGTGPKPVPKPDKNGKRNGSDKKGEPMEQDTPNVAQKFNLGKTLEIERPELDEEHDSGGQARLFVGGLPQGVTTDQVRGMFSQYGEVKDVFIPQGKAFAFVKMANRSEADTAKTGLRGCKIKGQPRPIRVKFANQGTSIEVKNLSPLISNERLYDAFARFGKIERAVVLVDERGKSLERAIIEFDRKNNAARAIQQVNEGCFFLTLSPRAVVCNAVEAEDADDGLREEQLYHARGFEEEYSAPPRFAAPETFEMDFGNRWKALEELERSQKEQVIHESRDRKTRLEQEMTVAMGEEQERLIRLEMERQQNELKRMEDNRRRQQDELRLRHEKEMEEQKRSRQSIIDSHQRLKGLVEGQGMRPADQYKPPPHWTAPENNWNTPGHGGPPAHGGPQHNAGGGGDWRDSDRRRSGPGGGPGGWQGEGGYGAGGGSHNNSFDQGRGGMSGGGHGGGGGYNSGSSFNTSYNDNLRQSNDRFESPRGGGYGGGRGGGGGGMGGPGGPGGRGGPGGFRGGRGGGPGGPPPGARGNGRGAGGRGGGRGGGGRRAPY